ncbi:thioredoxin family protein, partial [Streptococcus pyogenes]
MMMPNTYEELAGVLEEQGKTVLFFTADWCPDCRFIYPVMPDIEAENPEFNFVR